MNAPSSTSAIAARLLHAVAGLVLAFSFLNIYENYISVRWAYMGFPYREPRIWEIAYIFASVSVVSFLMPPRVDRPYTLTLWMLYAVVFVPTISISFFISADAQSLLAPLTALVAAFIGLSLFANTGAAGPESPSLPYRTNLPRPIFNIGMLGLWFLMSAVFLFVYRDIISFASIDNIYYQRAEWKAAGGGLISYMESYYACMVCPALMAVGFSKGRHWYILPGVLGFILMYATSAQKSSLVMPFIMVAVFLSYKFRLANTLNYTAVLAGIVVMCLFMLRLFGAGNYAIDLVVVRTLAAPAQTFGQYHELFSSAGYTWWSHIRGISLLVPPPDAFASDPHWPRLGYIVGDYLHGNYTSDMNANANPFSGEGVAAAGTFGVVVIGVILALWLRSMDFVAKGWNSRFVLLIMTPVAFTLTNGHLSTILLSFGGALWMVLLYTMKPAAGPDWRPHPGAMAFAPREASRRG